MQQYIENNINCAEHTSKSVHTVEHTNGRDFGLYNIGGVRLGVVLLRIRINSFKL